VSGAVIDARNEATADVAEEVARTVFAGGTVIFPNDTSYGLGCDPYCSEAIDRIYAAKGRPDNRPLTMHVATAQEFLEYAGDNALAVLAAKRLLPGPVILLVAKPRFISDELAAGLQTLAFRVPDDPFDRCCPRPTCSSSTDRRVTTANRPSSTFPARTRASCARERSRPAVSRNSWARSNVLR
jgi:L-threonylcarbamoyladenylate synthase